MIEYLLTKLSRLFAEEYMLVVIHNEEYFRISIRLKLFRTMDIDALDGIEEELRDMFNGDVLIVSIVKL